MVQWQNGFLQQPCSRQKAIRPHAMRSFWNELHNFYQLKSELV